MFDHFDPADYLAEYYSAIGDENDALLQFLAGAYEGMPAGGSLLEVGGGPTVYQLVSAAGRAGSITFADPVDANLRAVASWVDGCPGAFDWSAFVRRALHHEGIDRPSDAQVWDRQARLRAELTHLRSCDVFRPLLAPGEAPFDAVGSHFVTESITADRAMWRRGLGNLVGALRPGGLLVLSALEHAQSWRAGDRCYPAVWLTVADVVEALEGFGVVLEHVERIDAEVPAGDPSAGHQSAGHQGYGGMVFAVGHRLKASRS
jgi:hypothetical protein